MTNLPTVQTPKGVQPITLPDEVVEVRGQWIESKRQELQLAMGAAKDLRALKVSGARLTRANDRVRLLRKVVAALEAGYIPIPRFDGEKLDVDLEELPAKAIAALVVGGRARLFDEVRLVAGQESISRPTWSQRRSGRNTRRNQRDPLLVGVVRTPERRMKGRDAWGSVREMVVPGMEEHFLIAWWRPEDERMEEMF
jgi:hypothetical protein